MKIAYVCADPGISVLGSKHCSVHSQEVIAAFRELNHKVEIFAAAPGNDCSDRFQLPVAGNGLRDDREQHCFDLNEVIAKMFEGVGTFDLIYERHSLWSYAAMELAHWRRIPSILEVHEPLIAQQECSERAHLILAEEVARRAFSNASCLVVASKQVQKYVEIYAKGKCRVVVVPNGVNPNRFPRGLPPALPRDPDTFVIGFLGNLRPCRGLAVLAEAFAILATRNFRLRLLIVGDGPERDSFEQQLNQMNLLGTTIFTGTVPHSEVPGLLASMDVAVAPYLAEESHSFSLMKIFEYMAAGLPIVASRIGQISEIMEDEKQGLLVMPGSSLELARAIARLIFEPALRSRLGIAARLKALKKHTWKNRAGRILNAIKIEQSTG